VIAPPSMRELVEQYVADRRSLGFALRIAGQQLQDFARFACVIRPMSIADSDACRSGIPIHVDRRFR
jgi:hypothetical protein